MSRLAGTNSFLRWAGEGAWEGTGEGAGAGAAAASGEIQTVCQAAEPVTSPSLLGCSHRQGSTPCAQGSVYQGAGHVYPVRAGSSVPWGRRPAQGHTGSERRDVGAGARLAPPTHTQECRHTHAHPLPGRLGCRPAGPGGLSGLTGVTGVRVMWTPPSELPGTFWGASHALGSLGTFGCAGSGALDGRQEASQLSAQTRRVLQGGDRRAPRCAPRPMRLPPADRDPPQAPVCVLEDARCRGGTHSGVTADAHTPTRPRAPMCVLLSCGQRGLGTCPTLLPGARPQKALSPSHPDRIACGEPPPPQCKADGWVGVPAARQGQAY